MDNSPTSLFESYEQDFQTIVSSIRQKVEVEAVAQTGEQRKATLRFVEMELDEADEMVSQMEVEIQGMPQSIKSKYQSRVKSSKAELQKWKKQAKDLHFSGARQELFAGRSNAAAADDPYADDEVRSQRTRLLQGNQTLAESTRRLEDSQRIALETEGIGADILTNLRQQRGQIENARDQLQQADGSINKASGTLKGMIRRMYQQKIVTGAIITVLVLLILIILWEKLT
ncbi:hypothetical protein M407DRAFT_104260 [Tulasnella calospora MUT 4182]|uniref:t-SNARE coiled-coil homology domain-containing protein n=1 Tax=Tulasnella calospora MUT 4182 TaxID=1051891 RepID=A0A0C3QFH3_9AGAM|nr:hypothetical protein M407DRAFT_104260 [Tulasnella calospora MUT 4182]